MDPGAFIALLTAVAGIGGILVALFKFRGESTSTVVTQQTQILQDMKTLNDELKIALQDAKLERDDLRQQVHELRVEVDRLRQVDER